MRDIANDTYESTAVGSVGFMKPDTTKGETIQDFQQVVDTAEEMESEGLIQILLKHPESTSGDRLIDRIQFRRLQ
jgi:hypothetical protein